jgi:hypothetical protein
MTGAITLQSGNPSTVTAEINLLSTLAEAQRSRIESDMASLAAQHLGGAAAAAGAPATAPAPAAPTTSQRRPFDWSAFGGAMTGLFSGFATGMESFSNQAGEEAVVIAQEEAAKQGAAPAAPAVMPGKPVDAGPVSPEDETPWEQFTELITGTPEPAEELTPGAPAVVTQAGFPTWGWVAIGAGGLVLFGVVIWSLARDSDKSDDIEENYGFRYFL